jgi:nucleoside-diphosphate kinase
MPHPKEEKTVVIVKPDGVKRGLVGEIIRRLEQRGLKLIALKMVAPDLEHIRQHYPNTETWLKGMGEKTLETYRTYGKDALAELGTADALAIGKMCASWNLDYLTSGPTVAMVVQGIHAIAMVRKIIGHTAPYKAEMGTIRGDYSVDSQVLANAERRALHNLVHASGDEQEAAHELTHWFKREEIHSYKRAEEDIMF